MPARDWAHLTRREVREQLAANAVVAVPTGALEQHGDHLPTGTDTLLAETVTRRAAELATATVLLLPPIPFGISAYHARFGGTVWLSDATFGAVVSDVSASVRSAGATTLVVINGHGGNRGILQATGHRCSDVEFSLVPVNFWELATQAAQELFREDGGPVGHAGQLETSLMLHLLGPSREVQIDQPHEPILDPVGPTIVTRLGSTGVIGNPGAARAEFGERFLEVSAAALASLFDSLATTPRIDAEA